MAVSDGAQGFFKVFTEQREPISQAQSRTGLAGIYFFLPFGKDLLDGIRRVTFVWDDRVRQFMMDAPTVLIPASKPADDQLDPCSIRLYQRTLPASDDV